MVPYASAESYQVLRALLENRSVWTEGGWWGGGEGDVVAEGVEDIPGWREACVRGWVAGARVGGAEEMEVEAEGEEAEEVEEVEMEEGGEEVEEEGEEEMEEPEIVGKGKGKARRPAKPKARSKKKAAPKKAASKAKASAPAPAKKAKSKRRR
jgi:vacuolar protein sorting-associated protein 72